ncbi:chemotaxis protein CheZ [Persephonella hydrogeniphila]|uniref:Chemotaxis protein CheZ n=1 Tax=Persephonella hydrogeniphila TaxID=198703 RepID=A0A285NJV2_9AQUI|nr:protein phosphatase CheZ [Persephonella hydrogeniphila]SNZ08156.1 chemotaxis protein CheZ [Persephonella hydrogeniphila]
MTESLFQEVKKLLEIVEKYKKDVESLGSKREGLKSVNTHLELAIKESEEATKKIIDNILESTKVIQNLIKRIEDIDNPDLKSSIKSDMEKVLGILTESLTLLEFQDILSQRLLKISNFITDFEKEVLKILLLFGISEEKSQEKKEELKEKLEELEWKKEVSQEDVDDILRQFGM